MKYSIAKRLYELFGFENMNFEKFCWYLYKNGVITLKECTKYIRMEEKMEEVTVHELKILPEYFSAIVSGEKRFEIRKNDRNYKVGDILRLMKYEDDNFTGDVHVSEITYITDFAQQDGYVVLGIK
ncbi:DUF3850 domain-containing protein [Enterococcus faecalis]|nr:DUF3850 domain-containing protein [Enterococcus faecalis]